uniref:ATP-dependent DNA helicase n=1 Tax=Octopus bimaculoides TaxID=37653 RepID=A0A0L8FMJ1_OCTBM
MDQCYHRVGSLRPLPDAESKFVQVHFMGGDGKEGDQRCRLNEGIDKRLIAKLQTMLHSTNTYVNSLKCALERMNEVPNLKVVITADKRPAGEHARRFNAPANNEVAIIMAGEQHGERDIILNHCDNQLSFIKETHRSYDCLEKMAITLRFLQFDRSTGLPINEKVSCRQFYAYLLMVEHAPGGTGKTFIINLISAKLQQNKQIALAVALSGIAATLLNGGHTAHSCFKLPLDLSKKEIATCNISHGTAKAKILTECKLIIWDEATMSYQGAFEAFDRLLQDMRHNIRLTGGLTSTPCRLSFVMSINKAQGQTLEVVGLNLAEPVFCHGQLYVGCSRVGNPENLFIYAPNGKTKNIVHHEALQD